MQHACAFQKAAHIFGGRRVAAAARCVCLCLQLPLKRNGTPGIAAEIRFVHTHHHGGVGVFSIPRVQAHAVGHCAARFAGGRHHAAARTHTEGVNAPSAHMLGKLVLTPRQSRMARRIVVKAFFNAALQVLGPKAHRKRLCLQSKTRAVQHFKCIPGRVPRREQQRTAGQLALRRAHRRKPPVPHAQAGERRVEKHLPAQRLDLPPDRHNNIPQRIGADVRLLLVGNIPGRAMRQQRPGDKSTQRVVDACGELAV